MTNVMQHLVESTCLKFKQYKDMFGHVSLNLQTFFRKKVARKIRIANVCGQILNMFVC